MSTKPFKIPLIRAPAQSPSGVQRSTNNIKPSRCYKIQKLLSENESPGATSPIEWIEKAPVAASELTLELPMASF